MKVKFFAALFDDHEDTFFSNNACVSRGYLIDRLKADHILYDYSVLPQVLLCEPEEYEARKEESAYVEIYKSRSASNDDPWFLSKNQAVEHYGIDANIDSISLCTWTIPAITFPVRVYLHPGKKGLQTRFEAHPENNGLDSSGKYFFPDKSWTDVCEGLAEITGISKEFENFGFFVGHMVNFEAESPSEEEVLDWAWENRDKPGLRIITINHPIRGRYFVLQTNVCGTDVYQRFVVEHGSITFVSLKETCDLRDEYIQKNLPLHHFLLNGTFNSSPDKIFKRFSLCSFRTRPMSSSWLLSGKVLPAIVEDGIAQRILVALELEGTGIVRVDVNYDNLVKLCAYSVEEVDEMVKAVNDINRGADEAIKAKMQKGKLRFTTCIY